jgi:tRNA nucleotidyltransferase (CCA-adding enzyme)
VVAIFDLIDPVALALLPVIYADYPQLLSYAQHYASTWRHIDPELDGHDLAELGVPRGPLFSELLRTLRAMRLDAVLLTREDETAYVQSFLQRP